ncbi:MAG: MAPEG family protein [Tahibacter sp.]
MNGKMIFAPVLAQVLLTLYVYVRLSIDKTRATKAGLVDQARRGLHDDAWPDRVIQVNNNIRNQFELPVLFYVLIVTLWALDAAHEFAQVVAWLFVISRVVHLFIHTGANIVPLRRRVFTIGFVLVAILLGIAVVALLRNPTVG